MTEKKEPSNAKRTKTTTNGNKKYPVEIIKQPLKKRCWLFDQPDLQNSHSSLEKITRSN